MHLYRSAFKKQNKKTHFILCHCFCLLTISTLATHLATMHVLGPQFLDGVQFLRAFGDSLETEELYGN